MTPLTITFLGTGTSQGVPVIACNCHVCKSNDERDKRLRSSIMVEDEQTLLVIDSGPDFRQQLLRVGAQKMDGLVFTHEHKDHVAGMDIAKICRRVALKLPFRQSFRLGISNINSLQLGSVVVTTTDIERLKP